MDRVARVQTNGNETGTTINGGTWVDKYDDEDRLISVAVPSGPTDTFTYNGLGLRVGKVNSTGTYAYVCDGTSPGSPILSDGQAIYTPGLSERRNGASLFYNSDDLGNLWTADDGTGQTEAGAYLFTGFGASLYAGAGAAGASPLKYGGANDCQTDGDTGLVLMGCRYYDVRTGRFISQDPIGDGDNWYAYAGNSPTNNVDPTGLAIAAGDLFQDPSQAGIAYDPDNNVSSQYIQDNPGEYNVYTEGSGGAYQYAGSEWEGATAFDQMNSSTSGGAPGAGMIAASRQDVATIKNLLEEAGYGLDRDSGHPIYTKPGKPLVKVPNVHSDDKDHWVVKKLIKRLEKEILENEQEEANDAEPTDTQKFWASRTDGQLVAGSILAAGAAVGSFFIPGLPAVAAPILAVAP